MRHRGRHLGLAALVVAVALTPLAGPSLAQESVEDLEQRLGRTQSELGDLETQLGDVRSEIDGAEARLAEIGVRLDDARARLEAAEGQVSLAESALREAEGEQARAEQAHERAVELLAAAEEELRAEEAVLFEQVVQAFKYGTVGAQRGAMVMEVLRRADDPNAFAVGMKQLQTVVDVQDATVERVFELRSTREERAREAGAARSRATRAAEEAADTLAVVEELREEAASIAVEVEREEQAQREVLDTLRTDEQETQALLARVSERKVSLERELTAERARREAERPAATGDGEGGGRLGLPGAGGGPDLGGLVCPVRGAVAGRDFSNDWGYPRSGGRYHQGNDIFAAHGTPVVAVADGTVVRWNPPSSPTGLGGITVTYRTADGSEWYNAHLSGIAEGVAPGVSVSRGQQIGTVGSSGNARGTPPHLHLGRDHGGTPVNPWPTISPVCR